MHAAAWYQVAARNPFGFTYTPLFLAAVEASEGFTLKRLLNLPHRNLADDVTARLDHGAPGPVRTCGTTGLGDRVSSGGREFEFDVVEGPGPGVARAVGILR
ncbi:hypothetical protein ACFU7Y_42845 [Kitasatospora sp. NPDC057542]|uniref:hypothetical protein n=1 Tax=Kitasatospora sp. NPDC057542 TaxID=3346162 RepID=UPI0036AFA2AF